MNEETRLALAMAFGAQTDFHYKLIGILLSITKALPEESQRSIAMSLVELIEDHKEELKDISALQDALKKEAADGK